MNCSVCGKEITKYFAKQMCQPCYLKQHVPKVIKVKPIKIKKIRPTTCTQCGRENTLLIGKICTACYAANRRKLYGVKYTVGTCCICHQEKPIVSKGRCSLCAQRQRKIDGYKPPKIITPCIVCGKPSYRIKRCEEHFAEYKLSQEERYKARRREYYHQNREYFNEKSKEHHAQHKDEYSKRAREYFLNNKQDLEYRRKLNGYCKKYYLANKDKPEYKERVAKAHKRYRMKKDDNNGKKND